MVGHEGRTNPGIPGTEQPATAEDPIPPTPEELGQREVAVQELASSLVGRALGASGVDDLEVSEAQAALGVSRNMVYARAKRLLDKRIAESRQTVEAWYFKAKGPET